MENNKQALEQQLKLIDKLIRISDANVRKLKSIPEECIRTSTKGDVHQYYRRDPQNGRRIYLVKSQLELIRPIVQKEYELKINKALHQQRERLDRFIRNYDINDILEIYDSTCKAKQCLIKPIITPDEEYIEKWLKSNPGSQNTYTANTTFTTMNGEMVRSKSEKIIADTLLKEKIPYQYEPRLALEGGVTKTPDFAILNVRKRKTIYWEHFGRLSDRDYCFDNLNKLMLYEKSGYKLGDNLIISMESEKTPLDIRIVHDNIKRYLQ